MVDDKNVVFASCPVTDEAAVERTLDSGRYFVLRIQNAQGKHAFIGIAFNERNDSFDFNVALQEHKSECEREDQAAAQAASGVVAQATPSRDFSLKEGQKIHVNIGSVSFTLVCCVVVIRSRTCISQGVKKEKKTGTGSGMLAPPPGSKGGGLLAPPPGDVAASTVFGGALSSAAPAPAPASSGFDDWGSLSSQFSSNVNVSSKPAAASTSSGFDDFGSFSSSG